MADTELADLQIAVTNHLEMVTRLRTKAAHLLKECKKIQKQWADAEQKARLEDRKSRKMLAALLHAQFRAKAGRIEGHLAAEPPRIKRKSHEITANDGAEKSH
jgi:hypothetical protein